MHPRIACDSLNQVRNKILNFKILNLLNIISCLSCENVYKLM